MTFSLHKNKGRIQWQIYFMVFITLAYFLVFRYWSMSWLTIAWKDYKILKGFFSSKFVGWKNFEAIFRNQEQFLRLIKNTLALNILSLIFAFPMPIVFAVLLNELKVKKFKSVVQTISYLPHFLSTVVVVGIFSTFLSPSLGVLNSVMSSLGFNKINFLAKPEFFRPLMILIGIWQGVGWSAIIYLSAIVGIDQNLYEAAEIDGCGKLGRIFHVTLPGIRTTIIILLILQIGNLMSVDTEKIYLFQNDLNLSVSEMFPTLTYKLGILQANYSRATAIGIFSSVISLFLVLIANICAKKFSDVTII